MPTTKSKKEKNNNTHNTLLTKYMEFVLEHEQMPKSVFRFCKAHKIKEEDFYSHFGSFEALQKQIWVTFHHHTQDLMNKQLEAAASPKEKLLTYYFTLFEILTANRSYCLFVLRDDIKLTSKMNELVGLRKSIKGFANELIEEGNSEKVYKIFQHQPNIFSEAVWVQFLFLLRFWLKDTSPAFEKTDVAIEKSVQTAFDLFETKPLESLVDFGKFLWKEHQA